MVILACIGNRRSNWRVSLGRGFSFVGNSGFSFAGMFSAFAGMAGVGQGNHHSYGRVSLNWSCQWYWRVRRGRCHHHWRFSVDIYSYLCCSFSVCCSFSKTLNSKFPPSHVYIYSAISFPNLVVRV